MISAALFKYNTPTKRVTLLQLTQLPPQCFRFRMAQDIKPQAIFATATHCNTWPTSLSLVGIWLLYMGSCNFPCLASFLWGSTIFLLFVVVKYSAYITVVRMEVQRGWGYHKSTLPQMQMHMIATGALEMHVCISAFLESISYVGSNPETIKHAQVFQSEFSFYASQRICYLLNWYLCIWMGL